MIADVKAVMRDVDPEILSFDRLETLQVNLGNMCNQQCEHCHIEAGPAGKRIMTREVMARILDFLKDRPGLTLDVTGGCPELNPDFRFLVEEACKLTSRLMVRTNLTIFSEEGMDWLPQWYSDHEVVLIASLPCYTKENTDAQRGNGVFEQSIKALKRLNESGYGRSFELDLVYNPGGDFLPGSQEGLETDYRERLFSDYGIVFSKLFTIVNAPLGRFRRYLESNGLAEKYIKVLVEKFNPDAALNIMCRSLISVDWRGVLHNCDFNLAAGLPIRDEFGRVYKIDDILGIIQGGHEILMAEHCYCCTAGDGSSCTGALLG